MKIRSVAINRRKDLLELTTTAGRVWPFPFARLSPAPSAADPIARAEVDAELGREAVTFALRSGKEGVLHLEQALEYNQDPHYLAELRAHQLTVEALRRIESCGLSRREIARRLETSLPQLYRLLDPANTRKSIGQLIALLDVLGSDVELIVKDRPAKKVAHPRQLAIEHVLVRHRKKSRGSRRDTERPARRRARNV